MEYDEPNSIHNTPVGRDSFALNTGLETEIETNVSTDISRSDNLREEQKSPKEEARDLLNRYDKNYASLVRSVADRFIEDEELVRELLDQVGWAKRDNFSIQAIYTLETYELAATKTSILQLLYDHIDDFWAVFDKDSQQTMSLIRRRLQLNEDLPDIDYHHLADELKAEFSKEDKSQIDNRVVRNIIEQINYNPVALNQLKLCYDGNLVGESSGTEWARYFMLREVTEDQDNVAPLSSFTQVNGRLTMVESNESATGNRFEFVVGQDDNLWSISRRYDVAIPKLRELNKLGADENPVLQANQKIILPGDLTVPPSETIYSIDATGKVRELMNTGGFLNRSATDINNVATLLIDKIGRGSTFRNRNEIITGLESLGGSELAIKQVEALFFAARNAQLASAIKTSLLNSRARMNSGQAQTYRQMLALLSVNEILVEDQEQHLINKYQDELYTDTIVDLWEGLETIDLVERAHEALLPALQRNEEKINIQHFLSALASLCFKEANINDFLEKYNQKYGSFIGNMRFCMENTWELMFHNMDGTYSYHTVKSLDTETFVAANTYLTADLSVSESEAYIVKEATDDLQLNMNLSGLPDLRGEFRNGTFIQYQEDESAIPEAIYFVKSGDTYTSIADSFGSNLDELKRLNNIIELQTTDIELRNNRSDAFKIFPGDMVRIPLHALTGKHYSRVIGGAVYNISENLEGVDFLDGGTYAIHSESYNPYIIENILTELLASQEGTGTGKLSFKVAIYIKGRLALMIYLEAGLQGLLEAEIGDDRWLEITSKLQFYLEGGVEAVANVRKEFTILGHTYMFHDIKHFATHFNHDIYNMMLGNNEVMRYFLEYWDQEERQDLLGKNYIEVGTSVLNTNNALSQNTEGTKSFSQVEAPDYIGDGGEKENISRSNDMEGTGENNFINQVVYTSDFMEVTYMGFTDNMNKDNIGKWLFFNFKITIQNILKLHKGLSNPQEFLKDPSADQIDFIVRGISPGLSKCVQRVGTFAEMADPIKGGAAYEQLMDDTFGKNSGKCEADAGIELSFCYQNMGNDNAADWVYQYFRTSLIGSIEVDKEKLIWTNGAVAVSGGIKFEATYTRSLYEKPGADSTSYISTLYNGFMQQKDTDDVKEDRHAALANAQQERLEAEDAELGMQAEADDIKEYWTKFQDKSGNFWESTNWIKYKGQHQDALNDLFANFLQILLNNINAPDWENVSGIGKFIAPEVAGKYLGQDPETAFEVLGLTGNQMEAVKKIKTIPEGHIDFVMFEKHVLFNLYKEQQKHEFDYYNYKKKKTK